MELIDNYRYTRTFLGSLGKFCETKNPAVICAMSTAFKWNLFVVIHTAVWVGMWLNRFLAFAFYYFKFKITSRSISDFRQIISI